MTVDGNIRRHGAEGIAVVPVLDIVEIAMADKPTPADSPLDRTVDDLSLREEARDWATQRMLKGEAPETLAAELVAGGWESDEAEDLVEEVRRDTRQQRGIVTREKVVFQANQHYRAGWGGALIGFVGFAAARRLAASVVYLRAQWRSRSRKPQA